MTTPNSMNDALNVLISKATNKVSTAITTDIMSTLKDTENQAAKAVTLLAQSATMLQSAVDIHLIVAAMFTSNVKIDSKNWRKEFKIWVGKEGGWIIEDGAPISDDKQKNADAANGTKAFTRFNRFQATFAKYWDFEKMAIRSEEEIAAFNLKKRESKGNGSKGANGSKSVQEVDKMKKEHAAQIEEITKKNDEKTAESLKQGTLVFAAQQKQIEELKAQLATKEQELVAAQSASQIDVDSVSAFLDSYAIEATSNKTKGHKAFKTNVAKVISYL